MKNNNLRIEISLSELELRLLENEKISNIWSISAGKEESPTSNGTFHSSMKITGTI
ncbi:MAG: hypothetical protein NTZ83_06585 [Candidatus Pacearchaeota archaeon]|nr:hypothetical protein [Candidatus Pacearchaeota archaeon]